MQVRQLLQKETKLIKIIKTKTRIKIKTNKIKKARKITLPTTWQIKMQHRKRPRRMVLNFKLLIMLYPKTCKNSMRDSSKVNLRLIRNLNMKMQHMHKSFQNNLKNRMVNTCKLQQTSLIVSCQNMDQKVSILMQKVGSLIRRKLISILKII